MGGDGRDDDSARGISSQDRKTDCGNDSEEGQWWIMGVGLGVHGVGGCRYLFGKGVSEEAASNNCRVCIRETDIQHFYRHREDGGLYYVPKVVVPRTLPQTG